MFTKLFSPFKCQVLNICFSLFIFFFLPEMEKEVQSKWIESCSYALRLLDSQLNIASNNNVELVQKDF